MKLIDLLNGCALLENRTDIVESLSNNNIADITCDSRQVTPGSLFLAVDGNDADGHDYIGQAFERGAEAVIAQRIPKELTHDQKNRIVLAEDTRKATAAVAANFFGHPSKDLVLVGITGTNGKTTTTWILESILKTCGFNTGVIGTVNIRYADKILDNPITTPDAVCLQKTMHEMKQAGITHVLMEVSSHCLDQFRVDCCEFDAAVFTNLTQDHLDYHQTMEEYFRCKAQLFADHLGPHASGKTGTAIINIDDQFGKRLEGSVSVPALTVSTGQSARITAKNIKDDISGLSATINLNGSEAVMTSALTGRFNLENILCAAGAALSLGISEELIIQGIAALKSVPGRLEKLATPLNRHIFVDYAHTPDALDSILDTLSKRAPARLITVFGCGGDRDRTKRAPMGKFACTHSDIAIVTSDNPRTESPDAIVDEIIKGIGTAGFKEINPADETSKGYIRQVDRAKALKLAVDISKPGDIIVAAGKGHETYQITNDGTIHFDDMEHLAAACEKQLTPQDWTREDLEHALGKSAVSSKGKQATQTETTPRFKSIGTDSRTIDPDMVFLALEGENFDGHDFIPTLADKGVRAFIIKKGYLATLDSRLKGLMVKNHVLFFEAKDTLAALGKLAHYHKTRSDVRLVAITGSNGKTTTRKMTREIFATRFDTLATQGNFNNGIGVLLTLFKLAPVHQWAVIEMGMNHPGEISRLSAIAQPDIAVITNTSGAHLEGLKTADNVALAKSEIFESVNENGTAVIFADDPRRHIMEDHALKNQNISQHIFFGKDSPADLFCDKITANEQGLTFSVREAKGTSQYRVNSPARFMVNNAMAAIAAARAAGIDTKDIQAGLANFTPVQGRMNLKKLTGRINLIDDTYNANPASVTQALTTLNQLAGKDHGVAALGDMLELGKDSDLLHRQIGHLVAELSPAKVCLFGNQVEHVLSGALENGFPKERIFKGSKKDIAEILADALQTEDWLLLKGSRGMAMETLIPEVEQQMKGKAD